MQFCFVLISSQVPRLWSGIWDAPWHISLRLASRRNFGIREERRAEGARRHETRKEAREELRGGGPVQW